MSILSESSALLSYFNMMHIVCNLAYLVNEGVMVNNLEFAILRSNIA